MRLREAIIQVQKLGQDYGFRIVIVGGAVVRLIGSKTTITKINEKEKIIFLDKAENPTTKRGEDAKTVVDIDAIAFSLAEDPFEMEVKTRFATLKKSLKALQKTDPDFPAISLEPVLYHPYFPKPNSLTQFVSSVESYYADDFFFRLGTVKQDVQRQSLEPWTLKFDNNDEIITLMPPAIQRRYAIRGFSIKPKDKEKMWGQKSVFAHFVYEFHEKTKNTYEKYFIEWDEFERQISSSQAPSMKVKKTLWNTYWNTVGTYLAHGTGFLGKLLLPLGNTFFAGRT